MFNIIAEYWLNELSRFMGIDLKSEMMNWWRESARLFSPNITINYYCGEKHVETSKTD